jgi:Zn-finger nucleic acid-binding protein
MSDIATTTGCVHCHAPLQLREHETVQLLACPAGHGVFINAEALQVAVRDRTEDRPESEERAAEQSQRPIAIEQVEASEGVRGCPTCGEAMGKRVFAYESGVPIDVCDEHGIWLDDGELQQIEAWYEAQERYREADRAAWGGQDGKLEQLEEQHERRIADESRDIHWGPVGWFTGHASWWWSRRDDR